MTDLKFGITIGRSATAGEDAKRAEDLGYDSVWTGEHIVWRHPMHDGLMLMAAAAMTTTRVTLGTSILLLPLKHPVLVAKAVTTLDHLSGGRAILGVGVGGEYPKEFEAMGVPRAERGARANEAMQLLGRLWTEPSVTFKGRFWQLDDVGLEPHPIQRPPPMLVGGRRGSLKRTALYGDGWMPYMYTPEMYRADLERIEEIAVQAGRNPANLQRTLYVFTSVADTYEDAAGMAAGALGINYAQDFNRLVHKYPIVGTPQQCAERMTEFVAAGVRHFIFAFAGPPDRTRDFPGIIANDIIPLVKKGG